MSKSTLVNKGMNVRIARSILELVVGDIVLQRTDVIVNAANSQLIGGGGVDGAIHRSGGSDIIVETRQKYPEGCVTGGAVITGAGHLGARYIVHAVGPVWGGGQRNESEQLASAYRRSLEIVVEHGCTSVAFPSLSTGAYRYPVELAAVCALTTVNTFLEAHGQPELIRFVLFNESIYTTYSNALSDLLAGEEGNGAFS